MRAKIVTFLILLLSLMTVSLAAEQELIPGSVCACGLTVETFRIVNDQDISVSYSVELSGDAVPYATIYPPYFTLPPGGYIDVIVNLKFPCTVNKAYVLSVKISDEDDRSQTVTKAYLAKSCPNIQVYSRDQQKPGTPCQPTTFRFDITNSGPTDDVFSFSSTKDVTLSNSKVLLKPGQTNTLYATAQFACSVSGRQELKLVTETDESGLKATTPFVLDISSSYNYEVDVPSKVVLCENASENITIAVDNKENFPNSYHFELTGADWLSSPNDVELAADSEKDVVLEISPPAGSADDYTATLTVTSGLGAKERVEDFELVVESCYALELEVLDKRTKLCCDEAGIPVLVKNTGDRDLEIELIVEGTDSFVFADRAVSLDSGEEKTVMMERKACDDTGPIKIKAVPTDAPEFAVSLDENYYLVPEDECTLLTVSKTDYKVDYSKASIEVVVKNDGAKESYYDFSLEGGNWQYLETFYADIASDEDAAIRIYLDPREVVPDTYAMTLKALDADGQSYEFPLTLKLEQKVTFTGVMWETYVYMVNYSCQFTYRVLMILFILALVLAIIFSVIAWRTKKVRKRAFTKKTAWGLFYFLLVIIIVAFGAFLVCNYGLEPVTTYVPENLTAIPGNETVVEPLNQTVVNETVSDEPVIEEGLRFVIPESDEFEINLTEIFYDPDADMLYYTMIAPKTLDIEVDNKLGIARVKVLKGFKEGSKITVSASDGEYSMTSPPIILVYQDESMETIEGEIAKETAEALEGSGPIKGYYVYIILVLVVIVLFVRVLYDQYTDKQKAKDKELSGKKLSLSDLKGPIAKRKKKKKK